MMKELPYGVMEIGLHELEDEVEILVILGTYDLVQFDDVGML
jgi:hypothetical protein